MKMYDRRLSILLVTSEMPEKDDAIGIGQSESFLDDSQFVDYVELLSASNFHFDIMALDKISSETFFSGNVVRYSTVILTTPLALFSDSTLSILKEASSKLGISLISSYKSVDQRSKSFFGIETVLGKKYLWPLKVKIIQWPRDIYKGKTVASYGLFSGLPGIRKRGLKMLAPRQTFAKLIKLILNLFLPYIKVDLNLGSQVLATDMKGNPLAWSSQFGKGTNYYFALDGDLFLDKFNEMHRLVRAAIESNSGYGMVSVDLENTMVLRLDDPGASKADYLDNENILEEEDWGEIGRILEDERIPLSVMYTPGWVDDGNSETGTLFIDNEKILERKAGAVYDSSRVKYLFANKEKGMHDRVSEFRGLKKLVEKGLTDVHSHGLTHLDPDHKNWSKAKDRGKNWRWYHEFYQAKTGKLANRDEQLHAMRISREKIKLYFGQAPFAITPSGHRQSPDSDLLAYTCGYLLFSSEFMGIYKNNMAIRNWKIPSLFLYLKDPSSFASKAGYPFIGVIHDYEVMQNGIDSLHNVIKGWQSKGIKRFISLQELCTNLYLSVVGYWCEKEQDFRIMISMPNNSDIQNIFSQSRGFEMRLRVIPPSEVKTLTDNLIIVGNNLTVARSVRECSAANDNSLKSDFSMRSSSLPVYLRVSNPRGKI